MCLMKTIKYRFNNWEAFKRAVQEINDNWGKSLIHGEVWVPKHFTFTEWKELRHAYAELMLQCPDDHMSPTICGEINVEWTDPWLR